MTPHKNNFRHCDDCYADDTIATQIEMWEQYANKLEERLQQVEAETGDIKLVMAENAGLRVALSECHRAMAEGSGHSAGSSSPPSALPAPDCLGGRYSLKGAMLSRPSPLHKDPKADIIPKTCMALLWWGLVHKVCSWGAPHVVL